MVTKEEIQDFAHLVPDYIAVKAKSILKETEKENMDFSYIAEKAEDILRFVQDVSFDIEKCRAESPEEFYAVLNKYRKVRGLRLVEEGEEEAIVINLCSHCDCKYALPLRKDCKNLCPHCYQEVLVE